MREIKFRAWHSGRMWDIFDLRNLREPIDNTWPEGTVLMQYTGLKDKNGKDCYEKDKLRSWEGIEWQIEWNDEKACFELQWKGGPQPEYYRLPMSSIKNMKCEIIGNIYENPELLV